MMEIKEGKGKKISSLACSGDNLYCVMHCKSIVSSFVTSISAFCMI